jgi:imidazolonepropionase
LPGIIDLLLLGAGQLVTCDCGGSGPRRGKDLSEAGVIHDGAIAVSGGRIVATGTAASVRGSLGTGSAAKVIDVEGRVVMPGWVDPHTHSVFPGYRADEYEARIRGDTYLEIEKRGGGIKRTVRDLRAMDEDTLFEVSRRRILKMMRTGVTTVEIKSGYGLDLDNELKMLRVISRLSSSLPIDVVPTFMGAHQVPAEFANSEEYVRIVTEEMIPEVAELGLADFVDVFCEKGVFDTEDSRKILEAGQKHGMGAKIHADEIYSIGGTELAAEIGAVSVEHLTKVTQSGINALASSDTIGILLPGTSIGLASSSFAPARELVDAGAAVALATDFNPGSAPSSSMHMAVSIACSQMKLLPSEAINAATINAAYSIGMGEETGSLERGKKADFTVYDVEDYREIPSRAGIDLAVTVVKEGEVIWVKEEYEKFSEVGF